MRYLVSLSTYLPTKKQVPSISSDFILDRGQNNFFDKMVEISSKTVCFAHFSIYSYLTILYFHYSFAIKLDFIVGILVFSLTAINNENNFCEEIYGEVQAKDIKFHILYLCGHVGILSYAVAIVNIYSININIFIYIMLTFFFLLLKSLINW